MAARKSRAGIVIPDREVNATRTRLAQIFRQLNYDLAMLEPPETEAEKEAGRQLTSYRDKVAKDILVTYPKDYALGGIHREVLVVVRPKLADRIYKEDRNNGN